MAAISCQRRQKERDEFSLPRAGVSDTAVTPGPVPPFPGIGNWSDFIFLDVFVHVHPVTRGTKVVELRKERAPGWECTASPFLIPLREGN